MAAAKNTVRKSFTYRNCDDFAAYLNHMARLGWHFKEWRAGLVFEQGEPEAAFYAVEVFSGASEYDTYPEPQTKEFAEYCEAAGWQFIDGIRKFVVFKRIRTDAVPILTDEERLNAIAKATRIDIWHPVFFSAFWVAIRFLDFSTSFQYRIFSDVYLMLTAGFGLMFITALLRCVQFYLWKSRCQKRLAEGKRLFFGKCRQNAEPRWYIWVEYVLLLGMLSILVLRGYIAMALFPVILVGVALISGYAAAKKRPDTVTNQVISLICSTLIALVAICLCFFLADKTFNKGNVNAPPPLTYDDMGMDLGEPEIRASRESESVFGTWAYANLDYGQDYLFYDIYQTEYDWVLDKLWEKETNGKVNDIREYCTEAWGAVEAFRNNAGSYLVLYEDALWVISSSLEAPLTQEQIDAVIAALKEG